MKRLFIAIELPKSVKLLASSAKSLLEDKIPKARWVPTENIHLTMRFLGDCRDEQVPEIVDAIGGFSKKCRAFHGRTTNLGVFPNPKRARVLWIGIREEPELAKAYYEMNKALEGLGFEIEKRPFSPHITLARIKAPFAIDIITTGSRIELERDFFVEGVSLFQSHLSRKGAVHKVVVKTKFAGSA